LAGRVPDDEAFRKLIDRPGRGKGAAGGHDLGLAHTAHGCRRGIHDMALTIAILHGLHGKAMFVIHDCRLKVLARRYSRAPRASKTVMPET
jgi:hypothetical protein